MPINDYALAGNDTFGTYSPNQWITGEMDIVTGPGRIAAGLVLDKYTVLARSTTGQYVPLDTTQTDGRQLAAAVLMHAINTTAAQATTPNGFVLGANPGGAVDTLTEVYLGGCFNPDLAVWPASLPYVANSTVARSSRFDRTNIHMQRPL
jgi:hypothetical protein